MAIGATMWFWPFCKSGKITLLENIGSLASGGMKLTSPEDGVLLPNKMISHCSHAKMMGHAGGETPWILDN